MIPSPDPRVVILMGVSGSGKTTIGQLLAKELNWRFYEGDDFHPQANVAKMSRGIPLSDEDRASWLTALEHWRRRVCRYYVFCLEANLPGFVGWEPE
jgi:gluconokinase